MSLVWVIYIRSHWLPVEQWIIYNILFCTFKCHYDLAPVYTLGTCLHANSQGVVFYLMSKLPPLFAAWHFWTFHNKSHNMKALVILSHSWSPFLPLTCLYGNKWSFVGLCVAFWSIFLQKKLLPDDPCKSHDHDHQWADFVMVSLP